MDWANVLEQLVDVLYVLVMGLVPVVVVIARHYAKKWLDVELSRKQQDMLQRLTADAVYYAEEQASKLIKEGVNKPSRKTKMDYAFDYLVQHARDAGLPEMGTSIVREKIESYLGSEHTYEKHMKDMSNED